MDSIEFMDRIKSDNAALEKLSPEPMNFGKVSSKTSTPEPIEKIEFKLHAGDTYDYLILYNNSFAKLQFHSVKIISINQQNICFTHVIRTNHESLVNISLYAVCGFECC